MSPFINWHCALAACLLGGTLEAHAAAPTITRHPQSALVTENATAFFKVEASGDAPLSYQWRFNGLRLIGATSSQLILRNITSHDEGFYSMDVSNPGGVVTSSPAELVVLPRLQIQTAVELNFFARAGKQYALKVSRDLETWQTFESPISGENRDVQRFAPTGGSRTLYYRLEVISNSNITANAPTSVHGQRLLLENMSGGRELITFSGTSSNTFVSDAEPGLGGSFTWQKTGSATARLVLTYQTPPSAAKDRFDVTLTFTSDISGTATAIVSGAVIADVDWQLTFTFL